MIWLFDRDGEKITYEISRDDESGGFLVVITAATGEKRVERIERPTDLIERSMEQMRLLHEDGWKIG